MIAIRCLACGELRPFDKISVRTLERSKDFKLPPGTLRENYQYCADRPGCAAGAEKFEGFTPPRRAGAEPSW